MSTLTVDKSLQVTLPESMKVLIAHREQTIRTVLQESLASLHHEVVKLCSTAQELVFEATQSERADLIFTGVDLPDGDGITALLEISATTAIPAVVVTPQRSLGIVEKALRDHVMAFLIEPIEKEEILPTIYLVLRRFEQFEELRRENADLKQALEDRKIIERAKGVLMSRGSLDEEAAYAKLRRIATDHRVKLVVAAKSVLDRLKKHSD